MQSISLIAAIARNGVIGVNNRLPWHLPEDLRYFKALTQGHAIIMGRKTFESLGHPLPNRTNIVLTRDLTFQAEGCQIAHQVIDAYALCPDESEFFVIGGAQIYQQTLLHCQRLYLTEIALDVPNADAWFPSVDFNMWQEVSRQKNHHEQTNYDYDFVIYDRK